MLGAVALSGCSPADPPVSTPTPTSIFASEEEALAAATDVYQQYLAVSDQVSADGGNDPERLKPFVTDAYWPSEMASVEQLRDSGFRTDGNSTFDSEEIVALSEETSQVTIRLCADVSNVRILDSAGKDVTPTDRPNRLPLEVEFSAEADSDVPLLIARSDVWSDTEAC